MRTGRVLRQKNKVFFLIEKYSPKRINNCVKAFFYKAQNHIFEGCKNLE